jgi:oligo-alginate lyase
MLYGARGVVGYVVFGMMVVCSSLSLAEDGVAPRIVLEAPSSHPFVVCTTEELDRVRAAYAGDGVEHRVVARFVEAADKVLGTVVEFPPRGGQHNQWYQCEDCQFGLKTIDDTHHECPKCKRVYSGYPYDDGVFRVKHYRNLTIALNAAWAYAITEDEKYAALAAEVLVGYGERYRTYPYHCNRACKDDSNHSKSGGHLFEQTLTEASALATKIAPAYDLIHDASVLSEGDHTTIREGLLLPMLANLDRT